MSRALHERGAVCTLIDPHAQADGGDSQCPQVSAGIVEIRGHRGIAEGDGLLLLGSRSGAVGIYRGREHDGCPAAVDGAHCHTLRGQIGGKPGSGVQGIRTGAAEARRDEGGILADVLIFQGPAICRMYHLYRGGLAVVRPLRRVNGVI